jgi:capsid portal protein
MFDEYYPSPHYISAIDAIRTDVKMQQYDLNSVTNMFTPSGILTMNQVSDDNERQMILSNIEATFTGSENANNIIITFRNNSEDKPVEFTPITSNTDGVNLFSDTTDRTIDRILSAHRVSRGLIGLPIDDAGFSSEGAILQAQYNLTNKILVNGLRKKVTNHINTILKLNGIEQELVLKPLSFNIDVVTSNREVTVDETRNINEIVDDENEDTNVLG